VVSHEYDESLTCNYFLLYPIAFGVSFNLNLLGLFSTEGGKRDLQNLIID